MPRVIPFGRRLHVSAFVLAFLPTDNRGRTRCILFSDVLRFDGVPYGPRIRLLPYCRMDGAPRNRHQSPRPPDAYCIHDEHFLPGFAAGIAAMDWVAILRDYHWIDGVELVWDNVRAAIPFPDDVGAILPSSDVLPLLPIVDRV